MFSIWGGSLKISSCPQCKGKDFDTVDADKELEQEWSEQIGTKKCSCKCGCRKTISNVYCDLCIFCTLGTHKSQKYSTSTH